MNINQVGLLNQSSEKSNKVSNRPSDVLETKKSSHITVGQSSIQNALASSCNTYGKTSLAEGKASGKQEVKNKEAIECFEDIKNRMTQEDANDIEEEGMSLEKYNMERLDRTLTRMKKQKQLKREAIESSVEKREQQAEDLERAAIHSAIHGTGSSQVAEALENANLPVTEENILKISQAVEMAGAIRELSDKAMSYMVSNQLEPTIFNCYQAEYAGGKTGMGSGNQNIQAYEAINVAYDVSENSVSSLNMEGWKAIEGQVAQVIEAAGYEADEDMMENGRWLFANDLPITEETIEGLLELQEIKKEVDVDNIAEEIVKQYETGVEPEHASLKSYGSAKTKADLAVFLKDLEKQLTDKDFVIKDVTFHRELEEIRLKMTMEVSQQLKEMGVQIDMEHISDIIEGLKEIENSYYQGLLTDAGIDATPEQTELLKQTTEKVNALAAMPDILLGKTFATRREETLDSLVESGNQLKNQLEKAGEAYDTMGTEVRKDLGDSIKKAFQNISDILEDMGLEPTEANVKAVKILGYNNIAITEQSIHEMKFYDKQVRALMDGLKPAVTMEMIQSGVNPLEKPIEEINKIIEDIQKSIGVSEDDKYSEFLWKLDKSDSITPEERKAYIGMYRMLNQIEKSDGAAIGSVIKAGKELTLDNLMTAVKTKKAGNLDITLDESFGTLEALEQKGETIEEQIRYYRSLSGDILDKVNPEQLKDGSISLEKLSETVNKDANSKNLSYQKEKLDKLFSEMENPEACVELLENSHQEVTFEMIRAAEQVLNNENWNPVFKKISDVEKEEFAKDAEELVNVMDSDSFDKAFERFTQKVQEQVQKEKQKDTNTYVDVSLLKLVGSSLQLTGSLAKQERYNIPMVIGEQVSNVNVTIQHKDVTGGKVQVSYGSSTLGKVQAKWTVRDGEIKGFITADSQPGLELMRSEKDAMTKGFEALGFQVRQVDYSMSSNQKFADLQDEVKEKVSTKQLLQIAKVFIGTLSMVERREG
ncbi:DUF6240 domain-containing protein [[Clostridium] polysaccharolyticum]|nr:DUF6240 domain-containing protein [[Clostridium] polysaccharolyticum]